VAVEMLDSTRQEKRQQEKTKLLKEISSKVIFEKIFNHTLEFILIKFLSSS